MAEAELRGDRSGERVFTTLLWPGGPPVTWPHHLTRLQRDAQQMGLPPVSAATILANVREAVAEDGDALWRVRIDLIADGGSPLHGPPAGSVVRVAAVAHNDQTQAAPGLRLATVSSSCGQGHPLCGIKRPDPTLWWARQTARASGADDALIVCHRGHLVEAPTSALLVGLADGEWVAPGVACGAVASTTLAWLETVRPVNRRALDTADLGDVRWALLCNAVWGARPVTAVDGRPFAPPDRHLQWLLCDAVRTRAADAG